MKKQRCDATPLIAAMAASSTGVQVVGEGNSSMMVDSFLMNHTSGEKKTIEFLCFLCEPKFQYDDEVNAGRNR